MRFVTLRNLPIGVGMEQQQHRLRVASQVLAVENVAKAMANLGRVG